jgi:photosystem II stability/assembly factor-like uncharacterized protein
MDGSAVRSATRWAVLATIGAAVCQYAGAQTPNRASADHASSQPSLLGTFREDATLWNVTFVDREKGWAVGDRGVIWHTQDGGLSWRQQKSPVECALYSVFFLDSARGWAVGGAARPHPSSAAGVVLQTIDGGANWSVVSTDDLLPALRQVQFFTAEQGSAVGGGGPMRPSGVYSTRDGGGTWQALACDESGQWLAGAFYEPYVGAVAGTNGRFATVTSGKVTRSPSSTESLRSFHDMRLVAPAGGWLVGDGGFVAVTRDGGLTWQNPPGPLPGEAASQFDFHALGVHGLNVWIGGSPGTCVFHSADGGQTWQAFATGQSAPLRSLTFIDANHGWAVGELGVILATGDGGRTWRVQRAGGRRAAILAVFARAGDVPLALLAQEGAAEGYLTVVDILHRPQLRAGAALDPAGDEAQMRAAMLAAGATSSEMAWQFPLPADDAALDAADLLAALDRLHDGRAAERLVHHLARQIRMWRPEVIVTHDVPDESGAAGSLVERLVSEAVEAAGDPAEFPELVTAARLEPWTARRVFGVLSDSATSTEKLATNQFSPQLGESLAQWCSPARRLLGPTPRPQPDAYHFALLQESVASPAEADPRHPLGRGLLSGITLAPGGDARRRAAAIFDRDLDRLQKIAQRRRNLEELLERGEGSPLWAGQVVSLTDGLDAPAAGDLIFQLAEGYRTRGRLDLAADTFYLLAKRHPEHPLAEQALRWLVIFYASSEVGQRVTSMNPQSAARLSSPKSIPSPTSETSAENPVRQTSAAVPIISGNSPVAGLSREERLRRAAELGKYLEAARPALFADPAIRFPVVVAERELGFTNPAKRYFLALRALPENDPWRQAAASEEWLAEPAELPPPLPIAHCARTTVRPHLDGNLDEPFWQATEAVPLFGDRAYVDGRASTGERPASSFRLAYDPQFLYLAIQCRKIPAAEYAPDDRPRPRDADLSMQDRVTVSLDIDRDYTATYELTVDHRGWTHDACWGDGTWNPAWYVAAAADDSTWTIEAAIPHGQLAHVPPQSKAVWAIGARRRIPKADGESWPAASANGEAPARSGLFIFE